MNYFFLFQRTIQNLSKEINIEKTLQNKDFLCYHNFWSNVAIVQTNDFDLFTIKEFGVEGDIKSEFSVSRKFLNRFLEENGYSFIDNNLPIGQFFSSYPYAILNLVAWAADIAYTKKRMNELMGE